jgi:hypothetical protein
MTERPLFEVVLHLATGSETGHKGRFKNRPKELRQDRNIYTLPPVAETRRKFTFVACWPISPTSIGEQLGDVLHPFPRRIS